MMAIGELNFNAKAETAYFQRTGNPDADAARYAQAKGITLEEAKAELKAKYGDPQKPKGNFMQAGLNRFASLDNKEATNRVFTYDAFLSAGLKDDSEEVLFASTQGMVPPNSNSKQGPKTPPPPIEFILNGKKVSVVYKDGKFYETPRKGEQPTKEIKEEAVLKAAKQKMQEVEKQRR